MTIHGESSGGLGEEQLGKLIEAGTEAWQAFSRTRGSLFHPFVPADYAEAYRCLLALEGPRGPFLELGSGVGVVTALAALLGHPAYGIEIEPELVDAARDLAERFGAAATFVEGSFVPPERREDVALMDPDFFTVTDGADAYVELGLDLGDFEVIYAYPWPGEVDWLEELVRSGAQPGTRWIRYDGLGEFTVQRI